MKITFLFLSYYMDVTPHILNRPMEINKSIAKPVMFRGKMMNSEARSVENILRNCEKSSK